MGHHATNLPESSSMSHETNLPESSWVIIKQTSPSHHLCRMVWELHSCVRLIVFLNCIFKRTQNDVIVTQLDYVKVVADVIRDLMHEKDNNFDNLYYVYGLMTGVFAWINLYYFKLILL